MVNFALGSCFHYFLQRIDLSRNARLVVQHRMPSILANFLDEATREVEKLFVSRQGDAVGVPFEYDGVNAIYRFLEGEPALAQEAAIKSVLEEDVKNALFTYVTTLWFELKANEVQGSLMMAKFIKLSRNILGNLYRLHD